MVSKRNLFFQGLIFRFHVKLQGCISIHMFSVSAPLRRQDCIHFDCFGRYFTHVRTCDYVRVQSAPQWTASVDALHMSKPNVTRVQSATQWTASVHTLHMSKPNVTRVQSATQWTASENYILYTCPNLM